jgi:PAS domain S-box-containing protein
MSIRYRVGLIMVAVVGTYAIVEFFVQHLAVLPSFRESELEEAQEDLARASGALQSEIENLDLFLFDWSAWDDTYAFVADPNEAYEKANLVDLTFIQNRLNLVYFIDTTGRVVWGKVFDLEEEKPIEMDEFPARNARGSLARGQWAVTHPLLQHPSPESRLTGVFLAKRGPILLSSRPIITSDNAGPIRGTMLMGRFLDDKMVHRLCEQAQVNMRVFPLNDENLSPEAQEALAGITKDSHGGGFLPSSHRPVLFRERGNSFLDVYRIVPGIGGEPAVLLRVKVPRDIMARGREAFRVMWSTTMILALTSLAILLALLQIAVVSPITKLTNHVTHVGATDGLTLLPAPGGRDEVGVLAREFNHMVRRIQSGRAERVRAEDALRESEARIRAIIDKAPDGIITIDETGLIETFNPAAERLFGYSVEEAVGKPMRELAPGLYPDAGADAQRAQGPVPPSGIEGLARRKDGSTFPIHWTVSEARAGARSLFTAIVRDVTELKQMHESVFRAEHLATIGEMGASLAHEVRNPLAGISGAIQVLRDSFPLADERRAVVDEALEEVTRVDTIVSRLLMFAKMWLPARKPVDLRGLAAKVTGEAQARELWKDIRFTFTGESVLEAAVDSSLVEQVLWNLIENAADAILRKKTQRNDEGVIEWGFQKTPRGARVTLRDNGCGMSPEVRQKLFRPFFTTKTYGTGLGLVICRRIMEAHGGSIEVVCRDGQGVEVALDFLTEV